MEDQKKKRKKDKNNTLIKNAIFRIHERRKGKKKEQEIPPHPKSRDYFLRNKLSREVNHITIKVFSSITKPFFFFTPPKKCQRDRIYVLHPFIKRGKIFD